MTPQAIERECSECACTMTYHGHAEGVHYFACPVCNMTEEVTIEDLEEDLARTEEDDVLVVDTRMPQGLIDELLEAFEDRDDDELADDPDLIDDLEIDEVLEEDQG